MSQLYRRMGENNALVGHLRHDVECLLNTLVTNGVAGFEGRIVRISVKAQDVERLLGRDRNEGARARPCKLEVAAR